MINKYALLAAVLLIAGCSSTKNTTTKFSASTESSTEIETVEEAPQDWHHLAAVDSPFYGIGTDKAYSELLAGKTPSKHVIVAIIDSGTDIDHEDLSANIWVNEDEIAGNNIDDDKNGYVDDIHGWNFIGGKDGQNVDKDTYELTRVYVKLRERFQEKNAGQLSGKELEDFKYYQSVKTEFEKVSNFQKIFWVYE